MYKWLALVTVALGIGAWLFATPFKRVLAPSPIDEGAAGKLVASAVRDAEVETTPDGAAALIARPAHSTDAGLAGGARPLIGTHRVLGKTANVLLLGIDRNPGVHRGGLTDTLIVAALDEARGRLGLVSVPRDLLVEYPEHERVRINAVYALARSNKHDPLTALGRVLEDTLGIPIQHTIAIDLSVLERVVDVLGGVEVEVPCPIVDRFIDPRLEGGRRLLDVAAGRQLMDGATVAMYVRSRHGRSDWNRALRQQAVLLGLRERLTQGRTLLRLPELVTEVEASIQSDLTRLELLTLARRVLSLRQEDLHGVVLGRDETLPLRTEQQWSVLLGDDQAIEQRLADLFVAPRPGKELEACPAADVALRKRKGARRPSARDRQ